MVKIFNTLSTTDDDIIYKNLTLQIPNLITSDDHTISNLANFACALFHSFNKISWAGFYIFHKNSLILGPFQGKVACTNIKMGRGVCGSAAELKETIVVPSVENFPGHIACDSESKSEIVIPLLKKGKLYGLLDLDSYSVNAFGPLDKKNLEHLVKVLMNNCDFENLNL